MMLYLIGLGLGDAKDITLKGLEAIKRCDAVYLECYTSVLVENSMETLERLYTKKLIPLDRTQVEQEADELILEKARHSNVALLVVGDPFSATTHTDLMTRAHEVDVEVVVIHNASILNAIGRTGLQLYRFGETVSIVLWEDNWRPSSYVDKIEENKKRGLHTLCLLDIKMKEQTVENLIKGRKVYEPPRFMSAAQAASQLLEVISERAKDDNKDSSDLESMLSPSSMCVAVARLGGPDALIVRATLAEMANVDMGPPLHSLVVCGHLHPVEEEALTLMQKTSSSKIPPPSTV